MSPADPPLRRFWNRVKDEAPRQKTIATVTAAVRRAKPTSEAEARSQLVAEAAKHGVTDLTDKELGRMAEAVTVSAKEATTQAVSTGTAKVKSMWASLQTSAPPWTELPDDVAALPMRGDQNAVPVAVEIDSAFVLRRALDELPADGVGTRSCYCWLSVDPDSSAVLVHIGKEQLGHVPDTHAAAVRDVLSRRRGWVPASISGADPASAQVLVELPDRP